MVTNRHLRERREEALQAVSFRYSNILKRGRYQNIWQEYVDELKGEFNNASSLSTWMHYYFPKMDDRNFNLKKVLNERKKWRKTCKQ